MRQVRTRPTFSDRTSLLASSTCRCWTTAGSDIASGLASSLTEAGPRVSRSTMTRRDGSASAWNTRSRGTDWLSIYLSIALHRTCQHAPRRPSPLQRAFHQPLEEELLGERERED